MDPKTVQSRIEFEFKQLSERPMLGIQANLQYENDCTSWAIKFMGFPWTPYRHYYLPASLTVSENYPDEAPVVTFSPRIFHPNVNAASGEIVLPGLWSGCYLSIRRYLELIRDLLIKPSLSFGANSIAMELYNNWVLEGQSVEEYDRVVAKSLSKHLKIEADFEARLPRTEDEYECRIAVEERDYEDYSNSRLVKNRSPEATVPGEFLIGGSADSEDELEEYEEADSNDIIEDGDHDLVNRVKETEPNLNNNVPNVNEGRIVEAESNGYNGDLDDNDDEEFEDAEDWSFSTSEEDDLVQNGHDVDVDVAEAVSRINIQ